MSKSNASNSSSESTEDKVYSGLSTVGSLSALLGAIIATVVCIGFIIAGIYILVKKNSEIKTSGEIIDAQCSKWAKIENNELTNYYNCDLTIKYTVSGKQEYEEKLSVNSPINYENVKKIDIYYNQYNPTVISLQGDTPRYMGWVLIGMGVFIMLLSWFWAWAARKYKVVGALSGVSTVFGRRQGFF